MKFSELPTIKDFLLKKSIIQNFISYVVFSFFAPPLTQFVLLITFYTPYKHEKATGFLMFSGVIERDHGLSKETSKG